MKLNTPKNVTFLISVCLIVVGFICFWVDPITVSVGVGYLITFAGGVLLALGNLLKGLQSRQHYNATVPAVKFALYRGFTAGSLFLKPLTLRNIIALQNQRNALPSVPFGIFGTRGDKESYSTSITAKTPSIDKCLHNKKQGSISAKLPILSVK